MDLQAIFDVGVLGVLDQGGRSVAVSDGRACLYRGDGGRRCILGHSIPDAKYHFRLEHRAPCLDYEADEDGGSIQMELAGIFGCVSEDEATVLRALQKCHDGALTRCQFIASCRSFAQTHGLVMPDVSESGPWWEGGEESAVAAWPR